MTLNAPLLGLMVILVGAQPIHAVGTADAESVPRRDTSLMAAEYADMGMPQPDKIWGKAEYDKAETVVARIAKRKPAELPQLGSPKSGTLFARMVARENLDVAKRKELPLSERLAKDPTARLGYLLNDYMNAEKSSGTNYRREIVSLEGFGLLDGIIRAKNMAEFKKVPKVIADARLAAEVDDYLGAMRNTLTLQADSVVTETTAAKNGAVARQIAIDSLRENLPELDAILRPDQRLALRERIDEVGKAEADHALKEKILGLVDLLH